MLSITKLVQEFKLSKSIQKKKNSNLSNEHTKPIFNDMNLLSLHHLYIYHIRLLVPRVKLDLTKVNFLFQAFCIWNELVPKLMNTCIPNPLGIMVPGSTEGSDLSTSIAVLKKKLRVVLLNNQKIDPLSSILGWSRSNEWYPENFFKAHYPA